MNREDNSFEQDIEKEFGELQKYLDEYLLEYPPDDKIDKTINVLRSYVPKRKVQKTVIGNSVKTFIKAIISEVSFMSKLYWFGSFVLFLAAYLFITLRGRNPYILILAISPAPFAFGLMDVFRGREDGVWELEASCKRSIQEIMMSRLLLISIYSVLLNAFFAGILGLVSTQIMKLGVIRLTLLWSAPFSLVSSLALLLAIKIRNKYSALWVITLYMGTMLNLLSEKTFLLRLVRASNYIYFSLLICGSLFLIFQIKHMSKEIDCFEN